MLHCQEHHDTLLWVFGEPQSLVAASGLGLKLSRGGYSVPGLAKCTLQNTIKCQRVYKRRKLEIFPQPPLPRVRAVRGLLSFTTAPWHLANSPAIVMTRFLALYEHALV